MDTVETLRADLDALRAEFEAFRAYAQPVIDGHQPIDEDLLKGVKAIEAKSIGFAPPKGVL
jgi:hypothetical protein